MIHSPDSEFVVETLVLDSGERLPLLVNRATGLPLFDVTAFTLQTARGRGLAANTIYQALRAVAMLLRFATRHGIDFHSRFNDGKVLTLGEVEGLARMCRFSADGKKTEERRSSQAVKKISLATRTLKMSLRAPETVQNQTVSIR